MNYDGSIMLNILSLIYIVIVVFQTRPKRLLPTLLGKNYTLIALTVIVFILFDCSFLSCYFLKISIRNNLAFAFKTAYLFFNSVIVLVWGKYIDCLFFGYKSKKVSHKYVWYSILAINFIMLIINVPTKFIFNIVGDFVFKVNKIPMLVLTIINYSGILFSFVLIFKNRKRLLEKDIISLFLFPLPPLLGEIIQIISPHFSLICLYSVSIALIFQTSQRSAIYTDDLTGVNNRRKIDETLTSWFNEPSDRKFAGIMIDLDGLKHINDTYGHLYGDKALIALANIIRTIKRKNLIVGRLSGDEFIILWNPETSNDIELVKQEIYASQAKFNNGASQNECVNFSLGAYYCDGHSEETSTSFLRHLDMEMYINKRERKIFRQQ